MTTYNTTLAEQKALYTQMLDGTHHYEFLSHCGTNSIQIIPTENISFIDLREVSKKGE